MTIRTTQDLVSPETYQELLTKIPQEEADKLLLSVAQTMLQKMQGEQSQQPEQPQQPQQTKEKDPGAAPMPMQ